MISTSGKNIMKKVHNPLLVILNHFSPAATSNALIKLVPLVRVSASGETTAVPSPQFPQQLLSLIVIRLSKSRQNNKRQHSFSTQILCFDKISTGRESHTIQSANVSVSWWYFSLYSVTNCCMVSDSEQEIACCPLIITRKGNLSRTCFPPLPTYSYCPSLCVYICSSAISPICTASSRRVLCAFSPPLCLYKSLNLYKNADWEVSFNPPLIHLRRKYHSHIKGEPVFV